MNLDSYFTEMKGIGVMATSDETGVVDTAIYSRPHVQGKDEIAFVMRDRLTHKNLEKNKHANYLFLEDGRGYNGVRLFLTKLEESTDQELITSLSRRHLSPEDDKLQGEKFLVRFKVNKVLSLIGGEEIIID
ncbi:MAG: pyridoxamine 5'-phosphate oxidase family protein [Desulfocapsaceae bacterium]|nr:pyridoxamine 5'-phosphate oxidase family protein [Desulfocapsaceae bacterium]